MLFVSALFLIKHFPIIKQCGWNKVAKPNDTCIRPLFANPFTYCITVVDTAGNGLSHNVLSSLQNDPTTHDVTFKTADGGSLGGHRAIIAASSPVFHAMLYGKTKESKESEVYLSSINTNMLKMIFAFIYNGVVQPNSEECLHGLLQAAHYFNMATLETKCGEILISTLDDDVHGSFSSIVTFAVEHQLDLLFKQCFEFMESNADKVINTLEFNILPLRMLRDFVKSSNLEVREIDLFLAVAKWLEHQQNEISADDKKQVFQSIRYPLISLSDLIEKVRPSKLADQALYTAALEYHCMSKVTKSEFSQDQLIVRKYYFDFSSPSGLSVEQTVDGTVITLTKDTRTRLCTMAEISLVGKPIRFKVQYSTKSSWRGSLKVGGYCSKYNHGVEPFVCEGGVVSIMLNGNILTTKLEKHDGTESSSEDDDEMRVAIENDNICILCFFMCGVKGDSVTVTRL